MAEEYYFHENSKVLPRNIATRAAFENAISIDVAMGGSTNTVLHILATAQEADQLYNERYRPYQPEGTVRL